MTPKKNGKNGENHDGLGKPMCSTDEQLKNCKSQKRDIRKLLEECDRSESNIPMEEEKCCSWHKYVVYALPLTLYLPWLFKMARCPPRCCPPRYCCPPEKPVCPPPKLSCGPKFTGCPKACPTEPEPAPSECPMESKCP